MRRLRNARPLVAPGPLHLGLGEARRTLDGLLSRSLLFVWDDVLYIRRQLGL